MHKLTNGECFEDYDDDDNNNNNKAKFKANKRSVIIVSQIMLLFDDCS